MDSAQIVAAIANNKADRSELRCVVVEAKGYLLHSLVIDWKWQKVKTDCESVIGWFMITWSKRNTCVARLLDLINSD